MTGLADLAAAACFGISAIYHITGRTPTGLKWDLSGISILLAVCILLPVHSAFACLPAVRALYQILFLVTITATAVIVHMDLPEHLHVPSYVAIVVFTSIPLCHWIYISSAQEVQTFLPQLLGVYAVWGGCLCVFMLEFPKGYHHELWHILTVVAVYFSMWQWANHVQYRCSVECKRGFGL